MTLQRSHCAHSCIFGWTPYNIIERRDIRYNNIRLLPGMNFTCNGNVSEVRVAGMRRQNGKQRVKLHIWKENTTEHGIYHKSEQEIVLPSSICRRNDTIMTMYICRLPMHMWMVEPGDILGIELPSRRDTNFELYFTESRLTNYIFRRNLPSTIDLCSRISEMAAQPLIKIEVDLGMTTCTLIDV